eukprot:12359439-Ditylum_brightwellii.AAC.1
MSIMVTFLWPVMRSSILLSNHLGMAPSNRFFVTVLHASWMRYTSLLSWCSASWRALVTAPVFAAMMRLYGPRSFGISTKVLPAWLVYPGSDMSSLRCP